MTFTSDLVSGSALASSATLATIQESNKTVIPSLLGTILKFEGPTVLILEGKDGRNQVLA